MANTTLVFFSVSDVNAMLTAVDTTSRSCLYSSFKKKELENKVTFFHLSCSQRMLSSTYLLFENIKFCITETNFRMASPWR